MALKVWLAFLVSHIGCVIVAELCQEGQQEAVTADCSKYRLCREGQWKEFTCTPPHEVFDSSQGKCVSTHSFCLSQNRPTEHCMRALCKKKDSIGCADGQTQTLGCNLYNKCVSGAWVQVECKEGETVKGGRCSKGTCILTSHSCREYTINGDYIKCENGYYFDESKSKCMPGLCETTNKACKNGETKEIKGSCKKYKKCLNGVFVDKKCSQCQNFDENSGKCVFIWERPCTDGDTPTTTTEAHPSTASPSSDHSTVSTTLSPIKCSPGKRKPDFEKCSRYFECDSDGNWQSKSCWWFFFFSFDVDSYKCKFWSAKCVINSTNMS